MKIKFKTLIMAALLPLLCVVVAACGSDEPDPEPPVVTPARRTILVYMVANNSLGAGGRDEQDLVEMERAIAAGALNGCRVLVYRIGYKETQAALTELTLGADGAAHRTVLEAYPAVEAASVTGERLGEVIADMKEHAPAGDYGLVLWSHATGWAPSLTTKPSDAPQRVFGLDADRSMPVDELARAIPEGLFSWIYADACYMGGIEVAYELRRCCRRFVAYPTEIPGTGMPYDLTLPLLCQTQADLVGACRATYDYYNAQSGAQRTFSGVVVDCTQLDALAGVCRRIHASADATPTLGSLQCYNLGSSRFLYDFDQYTTACTTSQVLHDEFHAALQRVVLDRMATPAIFNRFIIFESAFSGLSTYALGSSLGVNEDYYRSLQWYRDVYPAAP